MVLSERTLRVRGAWAEVIMVQPVVEESIKVFKRFKVIYDPVQSQI